MKIIECIPNFSEGRNLQVIDKIVMAIKSIKDVSVLHKDIGFDANRTVISFAGAPDSVLCAAIESTKIAYENIDMRIHKGEHPRIGAVDVFPFVPLLHCDLKETIELSRTFANQIAELLSIPVYCYEESAFFEERRKLANCRKGEYEGLKEKLKRPEWKPDFGEVKFVPSFGAMVTGARKPLLAVNFTLNTKDITIAKKMAAQIREVQKDQANFSREDQAGHLKSVRAIGWYMKEYGYAQVSTNLTDPENVSILDVFQELNRIGQQMDVKILGVELIGLISIKYLLRDAFRLYDISRYQDLVQTNQSILDSKNYYEIMRIDEISELLKKFTTELNFYIHGNFCLEEKIIESLLYK